MRPRLRRLLRRLPARIERWTGIPLTEDAARFVAAERLRGTWDRYVDDLTQRLREHIESRKDERQ